MQDRRRTVLRLPQHTVPVLMRERQSSSATGSSGSSDPSTTGSSDPQSPSSPGSGQDDNPFAPPPEGSADQPWRPRHHPYRDGSGTPNGSDGSPRGGSDGRGPGGEGQGKDDRPAWGGQWSDRQPGRSGSGFGGRTGGQGPHGPDPQQGQGGGQGGPGRGGMRWDPKDVYQRRARYALLAGIWAFFFALFSIPEVALLLGALAVYWAISSLRAKNRTQTPAAEDENASDAPRPDPFATPSHGAAYPSTQDRAYASAGVHHTPQQQLEQQVRPQHTAAVSGLVAAILALLVVVGTYSLQFVYSDYYSCVHTALTHEGQVACNDELPKSLVPVLGVSN